MEQEKQKKTLIDKVWDIFASVKLAVVIFAFIALTSIVGTVLEQQAEPQKNLQLLAKMFGSEAAPTLYRVFEALGFMNMYHSWWFVGLLLLFAANLVICSIDRLPRIMKLVKEKVRPLPADQLEKMSISRSLAVKSKREEVRQRVGEGLGKLGFKPLESASEGALQFYAEKGNYTRLGVYITHLSILVIMAGALAGAMLGYNAHLNLPEGAVSPVAFKGSGEQVQLGFDIRCDNFEVDFYDRSDMPKEYKSWLSIIRNGQIVMQKQIVVNDPLTFEGVTFYQSSFGFMGDRVREGLAILRLVGKNGTSQQVNLRLGESFTVPGTELKGRLLDFSPAIALDGNGNPYTYNDQMSNPALYIEFSEKGEKKFAGWLLKRYPQTWNLQDGSRVEFLDFWGVQFTGMQVRKDPGVWVVYLGCIIMGIGLYMAFFMSHRRIWVSIADGKGGVNLLVGASANRNRAVFERKIEKLVSIIEAPHKGGQ